MKERMGDGDKNCEQLKSEIGKLRELHQNVGSLEKKIECMTEIYSKIEVVIQTSHGESQLTHILINESSNNFVG